MICEASVPTIGEEMKNVHSIISTNVIFYVFKGDSAPITTQCPYNRNLPVPFIYSADILYLFPHRIIVGGAWGKTAASVHCSRAEVVKVYRGWRIRQQTGTECCVCAGKWLFGITI